MENIICYDKNMDVTQKQNKLWNFIKNTKLEFHPSEIMAFWLTTQNKKAEILNEQYHPVFTVDDIGEKIPTPSDNYPNMSHENIKTEGLEKSGSIKSKWARWNTCTYIKGIWNCSPYSLFL